MYSVKSQIFQTNWGIMFFFCFKIFWLMIRRTAMRQACVQFNIFQSNDTVQNKREGLYTQKAGKG